ncbi:serine hydrolase domain-containing protein [Bacillus infantis]|uniref:serine hydrolase domain-containing protein n=1 Tax=Bacillus infantis TaxID=324767 RepID=UPI002155283A|nr:serine hydrolase domain-containing protein [Bacillus infantis]MCR6612922.1 beta-lactamase family protein [Bacillus infantis]
MVSLNEENPMNTLEKSVSQIFQKYMDKDYMAGGVCLVKQNDKEVLFKAYGKRNSMTGDEVTIDTVFDLASVTKIITSTLILKLAGQGRLSLDTTLEHCLPAAAGNKILAPLTIRQLLTHSSGLTAWYPFYTELPNNSLYEILNSIELKHQEESKVVYSDMNYILLGEVLKEMHDSSLQKIVAKELASPLKLSHLKYGPIQSDNVAATEFGNRIEMDMCRSRHREFADWRETGKPIIGEVNDGNAYYFLNGESGHAGLFGTAADLSGIADLYLKRGYAADTEFIQSDLIKKSMENIVEDRGLGWHSSDPFPEGVGHTGFTGTALWIVPEKNLQAVLLTNRLHVDEPKNINPFRREIFAEIQQYFL